MDKWFFNNLEMSDKNRLLNVRESPWKCKPQKRDTFKMLTLHSEWNFILEVMDNSYSSVNVVL